MSSPELFQDDELDIDMDLLREASPGQKQHYIKLLKAKRARRSPLDYMLYVTPSSKAHRHQKYLSDLLVAMVEWRLYKDGPGPASIVVDVSEDLPHGRHVHPVTGEEPIRRLMVSMPPQIGKSWILGRHFPSWYLTLNPEDPIIYMSYAANLAQNYCADNRNNIVSHPELGIACRADTQSRSEFKLEGHEGGMIARGFGGIPTGKPAEGLIVDDAFQDGEEAMNDDRREYVWNQYSGGLRPRVHEHAWEVHLYTRWHDDDLGGRLKEREGESWFIVNLPALAFEDTNEDGVSIDVENNDLPDPLGRKPGEAICPYIASSRFYQARRELDPFWFDAQYQGRPSGVSGNLFKEFDTYRIIKSGEEGNQKTYYEFVTQSGDVEYVAESDCVRFGTADLAATEKERADWYVMAVWDLDPRRRLFLRHIIREHVTEGEDENWLRRNYRVWDLRVLGLEKSTYDFKMIRNMIAAGGISLWPLTPDKSKKVRALPAVQLVKNHLLSVDRDASWRPKWEAEHKKFDKDAHDDQVDTTSQAAIMRDLLVAKEIPLSKPQSDLDDFEQRLADMAHGEPQKPKPPGMVIGNG